MARRDDIFLSFLQHELLRDKYQIKEEDLPTSLYDGLGSKEPIIKVIAMIVDAMERGQVVTDNALRNLVTQYLNTAPI